MFYINVNTNMLYININTVKYINHVSKHVGIVGVRRARLD